MGFRTQNHKAYVGAFWLIGAVASGFGRDAHGETLVHLKEATWGCIDPAVATLINDQSNPEHGNAQSLTQRRRDGHCISISTKSAWAVQGPDFNGLTYLAYRGIDQKSRSFWVPTDAIDFGPQADTQQVADGSATQDSQSASSTAPASVSSTQPDAQSSGDDQTNGIGAISVIALLVLVGLWRGARGRKSKPPKAARPNKGLKQPSLLQQPKQPAVDVRSQNSGVSKSPVASVPEVRSSAIRIGLTRVGSNQASWYPPGAAATVVGFDIADGMVYLGSSSGALSFDASFIDPSLPVASNSASAGPLGYWPSYSAITPDCRRRYLEWLAQGKRDASADIGYVFIYFYGLERRLVLEKPEPDEAQAILAEIGRLRSIYTRSNSFNGYSARLIEAGTLLYDGNRSDFASVAMSAAHLGEMSPMLRLTLARETAAKRALGFELAVAALCSLGEFWFPHKHVIQKSRALFLQVLRSRFQSRFPIGFTPKPQSGSRMSIPYRGASAGLSVDLAARAGLGDLPDPMAADWKELASVGVEVAELVASYSNAASRHPGWQNSLAALVDCPPELRDIVAADGRRWLEALPALGEVKFGDVAKHAIGMETTKWTAKHRREIGAALSAVGYAMEPGPEEREQLEDSTPVQVFRCSGSAPSRNAEVASAAAMLVAAIAKTAASATDRTESFWLSQISSRLLLTADEMTLLRARLAWLRTRPISLTKTKRLLEDATPDEKAFCTWSATVAVGATGMPEKSRVALLEAMHDALGVPRAGLYAALHAGIATATEAADEPIVISEAVAEPLHIIPQPPEPAPSQAFPAPMTNGFVEGTCARDERPAPEEHAVGPSHETIDPPARRCASPPSEALWAAKVDAEKLAQIRAETARTAALLAEVFVEENEPEQAAEPTGARPFLGLDAEHTAFLTRLLSRAEWRRDEFDQAATATGLMPDGAMEAINEWAFDHLDGALLDDGDPVIVNRDLLATSAEAAAAH